MSILEVNFDVVAHWSRFPLSTPDCKVRSPLASNLVVPGTKTDLDGRMGEVRGSGSTVHSRVLVYFCLRAGVRDPTCDEDADAFLPRFYSFTRQLSSLVF